jgi:hypothetical protein
MTRLELAVIEVGEFLHSDPSEFTDYEKAKKEMLSSWYYISDAITAGFKQERETTPNVELSGN